MHSVEMRAAASDTSIRVDVGLLDKLMNLVGELVLARNQILQFTRDQRIHALGTVATAEPDHHGAAGRRDEDAHAADRQHLEQVSARRSRSGGHLRQASPHRDGRQETELDKTIIEAIKDPLTHIVRNSVDHGIETPGRASPRESRRRDVAPARLPRRRPGQHRDHRRRRRHRPRQVKTKAVEARLITAEQAAE